jgi:HEPN domain-containing protein
MTPPRYDPDDPREWLNRSHSNLRLAGMGVPGVYLEELCFNAQQAAEKAIKAVFVHLREPFPFIHNLDRLLELLRKKGVEIPEQVARAGELTPFAFDIRYPGPDLETTEEEHRQAVDIAAAVVRWAEEIILGPAGQS